MPTGSPSSTMGGSSRSASLRKSTSDLGPRFVADFVGRSNVIEPALVKDWTGVARPASLRPEKIELVAAGASRGPARS